MPEALSFEGVSVELGTSRVLRGLTLTAESGDVLAVVGPNGSGKTTALRAALGLVAACEGGIRLLGRPLPDYRRDELATTVGYVPQRSRLDAPMRVEAVVAQGRYAHRRGASRHDAERVREALEWTDLTAFAQRSLPTLSGGERMRVFVARALATEAPVLLLDEPTSALDVGHSLQLLSLLRRLAERGRCVVVVLHDLEQARRYADQVAVLDRGKLVATGPAAEVILSDEVGTAFGVRIVPDAGLGFELQGGATDAGD